MGNWEDPTFDVTDPTVIANAISQTNTHRANPEEYLKHVSSLILVLEYSQNDETALQDRLRAKLQFSLNNYDSTPVNPDLKNIDWAKVNATNLALNALDLSGTNITADQISAAYYDLTATNLSEIDLSNANLTGKYLQGTNLTGDQLNNANYVYQSNLSRLDLTGWTTTERNFQGIDFSNSTLTGDQLNGAINIEGTNLSGIDFTNWISQDVTIHDVNFSNSNVTAQQIAQGHKNLNEEVILIDVGFTQEELTTALAAEKKDPTNAYNQNRYRFSY